MKEKDSQQGPAPGSSPLLERRAFLKLAALGLLASCDASPSGQTKSVLHSGQDFNAWVQAGMFDRARLVREVPESELTPESGFRVNGKEEGTPKIDLAAWRLEVKGLVKYPGMFTMDDIRALPRKVQNTKHICVEGWSMNPKWGGTPLVNLLEKVGADMNAKYLFAECADNYYVPYDLPSALHPQTLLCYEAYNKPLSADHGAPLRIVMPTKLGYKSAKWITRLTVTNTKPGGYWEDQGYDWFGGI